MSPEKGSTEEPLTLGQKAMAIGVMGTGILVIAVILYVGSIAVRELTIAQLGLLLVSLVIGTGTMMAISFCLQDEPAKARFFSTLLIYLIGAYGAFNIAKAFHEDVHWAWVYAPQSWWYVGYRFVDVLVKNRDKQLLPVIRAFYHLALGQQPHR